MGEEHPMSDRDGDGEVEEEVSLPCEEASSRYQSLQDIFSSRRPSLSDSLHFVKTEWPISHDILHRSVKKCVHTGPHSVQSVLPIKILDDVGGYRKNGEGKINHGVQENR